MDNRPIGIMDSGVGGLTVARVLHERYPKESMIFLGDSSAIPTAKGQEMKSPALPGKSKISLSKRT